MLTLLALSISKIMANDWSLTGNDGELVVRAACPVTASGGNEVAK